MESISEWLRSLHLDRYIQVFLDNDIDLDLMSSLSEENLKELGVSSMGHRKKLLKAIAQLQRSSLTAPRSAEAARQFTSITGERRQLTVMFCDLVGSTGLSQRLDPEELRSLIRQYQNVCVGAVARYEGHVAQFLGDGVLAYFGYPLAHEGEAERAIRAALGIISRVTELSAGSTHGMKVRIGIDTGLVVIGQGDELSEQERTAIGDAPNVAARLQSLAEPQSVVVSERTYQLASGGFEFADLGRHALKGLAEPVNVWQVLAAKSVALRFDVATGGKTPPMVGREAELEVGMQAWGLARQGNAQVLLICGEPGIGKSRFLRALRERLATEDIRPWQYQCSPFFSNTALYPIVSHLERAMTFDRSLSSEQRIERLETMMKRTFARTERDVNLVGRLLGLPMESKYGPLAMNPQTQKEETIRVLVDMTEYAGNQNPVVVMFEDVHWADPTTLEAIKQMINRKGLRGLVVMTYRPEFEPQWVGLPPSNVITLGRLHAEQTEQVATRVVGNKPLPREIVEQIVQKTDGVPLFVEELTKAILDSRLIRDVGPAYELAEPLATVAVPSSLRDSLMARLDRDKLVKEVAQIGATIGRDFSYELIAAVASLTKNQLDDALDQLTESGLAFRRGEHADAIYTFKHALVQDAAYDSLLRSQRKEFHRKIGEVLEEYFPDIKDAEPEVLAHHYTEAAVFDKASRFWCLAAARANARFANTEAIAQAEKGLLALANVAPGDERVELELELRLNLVASLRMIDRYDEALEQLEKAEELATQNHQLLVLSRIHTLRGNIYFPLGQVERCFEEHQAAFDLAKRAGSDEEQARALGGLGDAFYVGGRLQSAHEQFDRCVSLCRRRGLPSIEIAYLPMRATTNMYCLRFEEALDDCHSVMDLITSAGPARGAILSRNISGWTYLERHEFVQAEGHARSGLEFVEKLGALRFVPAFNDVLARILLQRGDRAGALKLLEESWSISRKTGVTFFGPFVLGTIALAIGTSDRCLKALREGQAILDKGCVSHNYFWFYRDAIEVSLNNSSWEEAEAFALSLDVYFREENAPWAAFVAARGRALAELGSRGPSDAVVDRLLSLRDKAAQLDMRHELPALDAALTSLRTP